MKTISIVVNGTPKEVEKKEYSFEEIVALAFGSYDDNRKSYTLTVTKKNDDGKKHSTSYSLGDTIKVKEGVRINVDSTNRS